MLTCSEGLPSAPRSCWEFTLQIQSQMGKNTRTGETTKKAKHGSFCCDGKDGYLPCSAFLVGLMKWVSTKLTAEQVGERATKRQEGKKHHSSVLSANRAQYLSCLPFLIYPGNSCAVCLKEGKKKGH